MKTLSKVVAAILVISAGTLMHFIHELPGFNHFWGYVFPVNECVWEHMKMVVWPMLGLSFFLCCKDKSVKPIGGPVLAAVIAIPLQILLFYTYWPFTHKAVLIADIILYAVVMYAATMLGIKWSSNGNVRNKWQIWAIAALGLICLLGYLTYHPLDMFLFEVS